MSREAEFLLYLSNKTLEGIVKYTRQLESAKSAAVVAGIKIMEIYETDFSDSIEIKEDNSPLTIADKAANEVITDMLKAQHPKISILSEESTEDITRFSNDHVWIVDPLDGTKEFIKRNGEFTVNIALVYKHKVQIGVIYVPTTKQLFYAAKGMGAFKESSGKTEELCVSGKTSNLVIAASKSHASKQLSELIEEKKDLISEKISAGSSLKGVMVAQANADVYYRFGLTCEWDTAAMQCIIEMAGGIFRQMDGSKMEYNRKNNLNEKGFYAVNRKENIWV